MTDEAPRRVQDPPAEWLLDERLHELPRVLRAGPRAIREGGRQGKWIFPNPGEQEPVESSPQVQASTGNLSLGESSGGTGISTQFDVRLERSDFGPHAWTESIQSIARTPFRQEPQFEGWDEEIQGKPDPDQNDRLVGGWVDSIDGRQTFHAWSGSVFEDSLFDGLVIAVIDGDPRGPFSSSAARKAAGARPVVRTFDRRNSWAFGRESAAGTTELGVLVLNQPQVTGDHSDPNRWTRDVREGFRVLVAPEIGADPGTEAGMVRSIEYVKQDGSEEFVQIGAARVVKPVSGTLGEIPAVPFYGTRVDFFRGHSPFLGTSDSQNSISNHSSELDNFARELALVIMFGAGWQPQDASSKPIKSSRQIGRWINADDANAKLTLHQPSPEALEKLDAYIQRKADAIRKAHRQLQSMKPTAPMTAREVTLEAVYAGSQLELWIRLHEAGWQRVLEFMALMGGLEKIGSVAISHDFGLPSVGMEKLWDGYIQSNGILVPEKLVWSEAKRHGWVDESTQVENIIAGVAESKARQQAEELEVVGVEPDPGT